MGKLAKRAIKRALGGSVGPAPKANKLVGEFRDPSERAGGIPLLIPYGMRPENVDRALGARRRRNPNEEYPERGRAIVSRADGGSVIDNLRESMEMRAAHQPSDAERTANLRTTAYDVASTLPVIGNVISGKEAVESGTRGVEAARSGNLKRALIEAGLTGLNAFGAVAGNPWGKPAREAAEAAKDSVNTLIPALEGPATTKARDMRLEGRPLQDIWKETQRTPGPEGAIKREIRDDTMSVRPDLRAGDQMELGDAVRHPALFNSFPQLAERPLRVTGNVDNIGQPVTRTNPAGEFEINPDAGDLRSRLAKLFQYEVNKEGGDLAQPLRHGPAELERSIDYARGRADTLNPADRGAVDAYLTRLGDVRDDYGMRREVEKFIGGRSKMSDAAAKVGAANAGNLEAIIASARAKGSPEDLKLWPYRRQMPGGRRSPAEFRDSYALPPESLNDKELQQFIERWHTFGSGRGRFANGGRAKRVGRALRRAAGVTVGAVAGATPGRADALEVSVPAGAYVVPADVVAALGEGNSAAGLAKLGKQFPAARARRRNGGAVPIQISDGEFVIGPEAIAALGGGDETHGHNILDEFVLQTRREYAEHLNNLPGPSK